MTHVFRDPNDPNHPMNRFLASDEYKEFMEGSPMKETVIPAEPSAWANEFPGGNNQELPGMETDAEAPGKPFYDKTLNFLWEQVNRIHTDLLKNEEKINKLSMDRIGLRDGLQTARSIFLDEFNGKEPIDPETGELIDAPFDTP